MRKACQESVFNSLIFDKNILSPNIENHDSWDVISLNVRIRFYFQISYLLAQWIISVYFKYDTTNDNDDAKIKTEIKFCITDCY